MSEVFTSLTADLRARLQEINDLNKAAYVLYWDMTTQMPPGGAGARSRQLATLERIAHERAIDPALGRTLDEAEQRFAAEHSGADPTQVLDSNDAALLRLARRDYERRIRVPVEFTAEVAAHCSRTYSVWAKARAENNFAAVQPLLEKTLALSKQFAGFFEHHAHPADPFIDAMDYGLTVALIRPIFQELGERLAPLVKTISAQPKPRHDFLHRHYPEAKQLAFTENVARRFGYDFQRGRQDKTHHPFMVTFAHGDVRITTRVDEHDPSENLFSVMHEVGHALYEQGIDAGYDGTPLFDGTSMGVHESQSRLWENLVGRSRDYWENSYHEFQNAFPEQLGDVSLDEFYRAINRVEPSLIRTDADEVTYNLHVLIRFELECQMLEGELAIADLPAAWHTAYEKMLGIRSPNDADGVMQDVHWYNGSIGGSFQGYALGNILSCQFFEMANKENANLAQQIRKGDLTPLRHWLQTNVYRFGSKYTTQELLERVTGTGISLEPYFRYLHQKYGALYKLDDIAN